MHQSALKYGKLFFETYLQNRTSEQYRIVDVGSQDINGSLRQFAPSGVEYVGVDFAQGNGVDLILSDPYRFPFDSNTVDAVVCSSVFEHSEFFWLLFLECIRIAKPEGLIYINAPSNGMVHRYPVDSWRFYPDAGHSLAHWARHHGEQTQLMESFIAPKMGPITGEGVWNDFVAVFIKHESHSSRHKLRILDHEPAACSIYRSDREIDRIQIESSSDQIHMVNQEAKINLQLEKITSLVEQISDSGQDLWQNFIHRSEVLAREKELVDALDGANLGKQELEKCLTLMAQQLDAAKAEALAKAVALDETRHSTSWKITAPLRLAKTSAWQLTHFMEAQTGRGARWAWRKLPLSAANRQRVRQLLSRGAPPAGETNGMAAEQTAYHARAAEYVPRLTAPPPLVPTTRVIAFYLPQFHPIPENDAWWGKDFTEWTNVIPAKPYFVDHYQPHVPDELGYYDLRDTTVQARQIELAKLYGVGGFCFYFYWFAGKCLLEAPTRNYLNDPSLDFPFMLCWANENWSRRWDGLDHEILIRQQHSPEDDLAFIQYIAEYLRDPRYIRIDGKPVLVVYRPSQLPSAIATSQRWRSWCRENGIGEIYLAYTQSFEKADPALYGLDGAIEFPPNNSAPPDITHTVTALDGDFQSRIYDWSAVARRSENYTPATYDLFRSVCPGWDNTARRKGKASVFLHNSPLGFSRWLANAIADTAKRFESPSSRLVFVNAWNEWGEGAHLEPDARNGYAYLEAIRVTLQRTAAAAAAANGLQASTRPAEGPCAAAIVVHAYYPDVLDEILGRVADLDPRHRLFVTTDREHYLQVREKLESANRHFSLHPMENRGRDVLPFLKVLPHVRAQGYEFVVKVHTKKSPHRRDGSVWRQQLYDALLSRGNVERALAAFAADPGLGMIGPDKHFVSMKTYMGSNRSRVFSTGHRLGLTERDILGQGFFAGTMFAARLAALSPLCSLAFRDEDFEEESGQIDGTLAHALERAFALSVKASGQRISSDLRIKAADTAAVPRSRFPFARH
jgi:lipopolysaccharide biosynthesis protein/SAM-dependent methyltransferase